MARVALAVLVALAGGAPSALAEGETPAPEAAAGRAAQDFVAANELALKGDAQGAIALYQALLAQGVVHEDLYFNLGNAYAQSGRSVDAVLAYERALRLAPGDHDARANLALVRRRLGADPSERADGPAERGDVVLADVVEPLIAPFPARIFALLAPTANLALFTLLFLRRRAAADRARRRLGVGVLGAGLLLAVALLVTGGHYIVARDPRAVVREGGDLKEGPHARFKAGGRIAAGERVRTLEEDGGFVRVLRTDGTRGWVGAKSLERL